MIIARTPLKSRPTVDANPSISSGVPTIDELTKGGYPKGKITLITGGENSGKTTLACHALAQGQKEGSVLIIDADGRFNFEYAAQLGVATCELYYSMPQSGRQAFQIAREAIQSQQFSLIVVDTLTSLISDEEIKGEAAMLGSKLHTEMIAVGFRQLNHDLQQHGQDCALVFTNQLITDHGVSHGERFIPSGGVTPLQCAATHLRLYREIGLVSLPDYIPIGQRTKVKLLKHVGSKPQEAECDLIYGEGFPYVNSIFDLALEMGVLFQQKGNYFLDGVLLGVTRQDSIEACHSKRTLKKLERLIAKERKRLCAK